MSSPKVVPIGRAKPVEDVVKNAEDLLRFAKSGELRDLAWCGTSQDEKVITGITSSNNSLLRLSAVSRLLHRLHVNLDDGTENVDAPTDVD